MKMSLQSVHSSYQLSYSFCTVLKFLFTDQDTYFPFSHLWQFRQVKEQGQKLSFHIRNKMHQFRFWLSVLTQFLKNPVGFVFCLFVWGFCVCFVWGVLLFFSFVFIQGFLLFALHCKIMCLDLFQEFCIDLSFDVCCFGLGSENRTLAC